MRSLNKKVHLDVLRIIAIWMVVYTHTWKMGYTLFTEKTDSRFFWIYISFSIFIKCAVPIFWMVSGALLLSKEETLKELFRKRIAKYFMVLVGFSLMQYYYLSYKGEVTDISILNFGEKFYSDCMAIAYWYLYAYLGYLLMLPFIRKLAKGMKKAEYIYLFATYTFFFGVIPLIEYFVFHNQIHLTGYFQIPIITASCIVYPLLGYYVENKMKILQEKKLLIFSVVSLISIFLIAYLTREKCIMEQDWKDTHVDTFFNYLLIFPTFTLYGWIKWLFEKISVKDETKSILFSLGKCTLGIMLIENILRDALISWYTNNIIFAFYKVTEVVLVGFVIVYIVRKVLECIVKCRNK